MMELNADLNSLPQFIELVHRCSADLEFDNSSIMQIELALEEVIVNIINYAYPDTDKPGKIRLFCKIEGDTLKMEIADDGIPFDMLTADDPDIDASLEDRHIGGLGVFFVKQLMDEVKYERRGDENFLSLTKCKK